MVTSHTVAINVVVNSGGVPKSLNQLGIAGQQAGAGLHGTHQSAQRASQSLINMHGVMATLTKALISMVGVTIAWNLTIRAAELSVMGFLGAMQLIIKTVGEYEEKVIGLKAVLASSETFDADPIQNYAKAGNIAASVMRELTVRAREIRTTFDNAAEAFALLEAGGVFYNKTAKQAIDFTITLVNAISAIAPQRPLLREVGEVMRALTTGQSRSSETKILLGNTEQLTKLVDQAARGVDIFPVLEERLRGYAMASKELGRTLTGLTTTVESLWTMFATQAFGGVFNELRKSVEDLIDTINKSKEQMLEFETAIGSAVNEIIKGFKKFGSDFGLTFDAILAYAKDRFQRFTANVLTLLEVIERPSELFKGPKAIGGPVAALIVMYYKNLVMLQAAAKKQADEIVLSEQGLADLAAVILKNKQQQSGVDEKRVQKMVDLLAKYREQYNLAQVQGLENEKQLELLIKYDEEVRRIKEGMKEDPMRMREALRYAEATLRIELQRLDVQSLLERAKALSTTEKFWNEQYDKNLKGFVTAFEQAYKKIQEAAEKADKTWQSTWKSYVDNIDLAIIRADILLRVTDNMVESFDKGARGLRSFLGHIHDLAKAYNDLSKAIPDIIKKQDEIREAMSLDFSDEELTNLEDFYRRLEAMLERMATKQRQLMDRMISFIEPFAQAFAGFFENIVSGADSVGQAFKKMIGQMISAIGDLIIAYGIAMMAEGFLTWNFGKVGLGAMYVALGGAVKGIAALLMGGGGGKNVAGEKAESTSGSGERTVYITPISREQAVNQAFYRDLVQSVSTLNSTLSSFSTKPTGVLFKEGVSGNGSVVTNEMKTHLSKDVGARVSFTKVAMGEI